MAAVVKVAFGLVLVLAVVCAGIFLARAVLSRDPNAFAHSIGSDTWSGRFALSGVVVGAGAVIGMGVSAVLDLVLRPWPEASHTFGGLAALGALGALSHMERLPRLQHDNEVLGAAGAWEREQLRYTHTPDDGTIARLLAESEDATKTSVERGIAATKHGFAVALKARDARMEALILRRHEQALADKAAADKQAAREAPEAREREAARDAAYALVATHVDRLPAVSSERVDTDGVIDQAVLMELWAEFKRLVVQARPASPAGAGAAASKLKSNVAQLRGVSIAPEVQVEFVYSGNERDGFHDAVAPHAAGPVPLYQRLRFEGTTTGLANALFFAAALDRKWSWGHGFYGRDAELIVDEEHLQGILEKSRGQQPPDGTRWPPPGFRVQRTDEGFTVSSLALKPGKGLLDLSIEVKDGTAGPLQAKELFVWGRGVLY